MNQSVVRELIEKAKSLKNIELELRVKEIDISNDLDQNQNQNLNTNNNFNKQLNNLNGKKTRNGIKKSTFDRLENYFLKSRNQNPNIIRQMDYVFDHGIRYRKDNENCGVFVQKNSIERYDFEEDSLQFRLSLMNEIEVPNEEGNLNFIRFKERKTFLENINIKVDFTKVWQGRNIEEVKRNEPIYELELEFIDLKRNTDEILAEFMKFMYELKSNFSEDRKRKSDCQEKFLPIEDEDSVFVAIEQPKSSFLNLRKLKKIK